MACPICRGGAEEGGRVANIEKQLKAANIDRLPQTSAASKRYLKKSDDQGTQIEKLQAARPGEAGAGQKVWKVWEQVGYSAGLGSSWGLGNRSPARSSSTSSAVFFFSVAVEDRSMVSAVTRQHQQGHRQARRRRHRRDKVDLMTLVYLIRSARPGKEKGCHNSLYSSLCVKLGN